MSIPDLLQGVAVYYGERVRRFGATPAGVDWRDAASQQIRFEQLGKVIGEPDASVLDLGCGYGAMLDFLRQRGFGGRYFGFDVAPDMIAAAHVHHRADPSAQFEIGWQPSIPADYAIASGIFNVRQKCGVAEWREYVNATLGIMNDTGTRGFAFNCLTSYSDRDKMRPDLFYADPAYYFDLCKRLYSRQVALLHDYGLYEFTVIVRKDL